MLALRSRLSRVGTASGQAPAGGSECVLVGSRCRPRLLTQRGRQPAHLRVEVQHCRRNPAGGRCPSYVTACHWGYEPLRAWRMSGGSPAGQGCQSIADNGRNWERVLGFVRSTHARSPLDPGPSEWEATTTNHAAAGTSVGGARLPLEPRAGLADSWECWVGKRCGWSCRCRGCCKPATTNCPPQLGALAHEASECATRLRGKDQTVRDICCCWVFRFRDRKLQPDPSLALALSAGKPCRPGGKCST